MNFLNFLTNLKNRWFALLLLNITCVQINLILFFNLVWPWWILDIDNWGQWFSLGAAIFSTFSATISLHAWRFYLKWNRHEAALKHHHALLEHSYLHNDFPRFNFHLEQAEAALEQLQQLMQRK
jgi:hypothetical protein